LGGGLSPPCCRTCPAHRTGATGPSRFGPVSAEERRTGLMRTGPSTAPQNYVNEMEPRATPGDRSGFSPGFSRRLCRLPPASSRW
jgi:hypothetical protein